MIKEAIKLYFLPLRICHAVLKETFLHPNKNSIIKIDTATYEITIERK